MLVDPIIWSAIVAAVAILLTVLGWFLQRERAELKENHKELSGKIDRVETDVSEIKAKLGHYVTREESELAHTRILEEQRRDRAEMRGFLTAWLERIERALERKQDRVT